MLGDHTEAPDGFDKRLPDTDDEAAPFGRTDTGRKLRAQVGNERTERGEQP